MASFHDAAGLLDGSEPRDDQLSTSDILGVILNPKQIRAAVEKVKEHPDDSEVNTNRRGTPTDGLVNVLHTFAMQSAEDADPESLFDTVADVLRGVTTIAKWVGRGLIRIAWWTARSLVGLARMVLRRVIPIIYDALEWVIRGILFTPEGWIALAVTGVAALGGYVYYKYVADDAKRKSIDDTWANIKHSIGFSHGAESPNYPPGAYAGGEAPPQAQVPGDVSTRASIVANVLMRDGWTKDQAIGMTSTLIAESQLNPNIRPAYNEAAFGKQYWIDPATGTKYASSAFGIGQWLNARQGRFQERFGKSIIGSTLEEQAEFFNYELRKYYPKVATMIGNATSAADASGYLTQYYEVPGGDMGQEIRKHQRFIGSVSQALNGSDGTALAQNAPDIAATAQKPDKPQQKKVADAAATRQQTSSEPPANDSEHVAIGPAGNRIVTRG